MPTIEEFLATPDPPQLWICDPYIARESITFLHGKTSIGKSPLTWEMARCTSQGIPFLGFPTYQSRVLYIEADTPTVVVRRRLRDLPKPVGSWWIECIQNWGLDLANPGTKGMAALQGLHDSCKPDLVFWNTLRSLTRGDLSRGETVSSVYQTMRMAFPHAGHMLIHHNRKESTDLNSIAVPDEDHSGSGAWRDTAQIVLHLRLRGVSGKSWLSLEHTKTQASEMMTPLRLELAEDGMRWVRDTRQECIREREAELLQSHTPAEAVRLICEELSIGRATYFRLRGPVSSI